jgi:hypothetical protein
VVDIVFDETSATYSIPDSVKGVTVSKKGANVTVKSTTTANEYTFRLSGSSSNGSFTLNAQNKLKVELAGLTLTNGSGGSAIDIECGKRIDVLVDEGTVNTLCDSKSGSQKAAFYIKGHAEFKGGGTLNVTGKLKHAISVKEYCELKSDFVGTLNILGAVSDGIHCGKGEKKNENNYFLMKSGTVNISNIGSDGIDSDDYGVTTIAGGTLNIRVPDDGCGLKADSTVNIKGGTLTINVAGLDCKGVRANHTVNISGGNSIFMVSGDGSKGIKGNCHTSGSTVLNGGYVNISGGTTEMLVTGGNYITTDSKGVADTTKCMGMSIDSDFVMTDGTVTIKAIGDEARTYNVKGTETLEGGTLTATNISEEERKKGDVNCDGAVDVADVSAIVSVMAETGIYGATADVNEDGTVDVADISAVITAMSLE